MIMFKSENHVTIMLRGKREDTAGRSTQSPLLLHRLVGENPESWRAESIREAHFRDLVSWDKGKSNYSES
jgi:hypothetical protein